MTRIIFAFHFFFYDIQGMKVNQKIRLILIHYKRLNLRLNSNEQAFLKVVRDKVLTDSQLKKFYAIYNNVLKQINEHENIQRTIKEE